MIPLAINNVCLCKIFEPSLSITGWSEAQIIAYSLDKQMFPSEVVLSSETYSRDAERTADYELEYLTVVNRKAKPEFSWSLIKADYVENLMTFLGYTYNFKNNENVVIPVEAADILVKYQDFVGERTIHSYLGQTIEGTLVENNNTLYWQDFRIAFPER